MKKLLLIIVMSLMTLSVFSQENNLAYYGNKINIVIEGEIDYTDKTNISIKLPIKNSLFTNVAIFANVFNDIEKFTVVRDWKRTPDYKLIEGDKASATLLISKNGQYMLWTYIINKDNECYLWITMEE